MAALSDFAEPRVLTWLLRQASAPTFTPAATLYVALYTVAPTDAGAGTEVTGGGYARQSVTFAAPVDNGAGGYKVTNSNALTFDSMPTATIVAWGIFDAATAGNLYLHGSMTPNVSTTDGTPLGIKVGALTVNDA